MMCGCLLKAASCMKPPACSVHLRYSDAGQLALLRTCDERTLDFHLLGCWSSPGLKGFFALCTSCEGIVVAFARQGDGDMQWRDHRVGLNNAQQTLAHCACPLVAVQGQIRTQQYILERQSIDMLLDLKSLQCTVLGEELQPVPIARNSASEMPRHMLEWCRFKAPTPTCQCCQDGAPLCRDAELLCQWLQLWQGHDAALQWPLSGTPHRSPF